MPNIRLVASLIAGTGLTCALAMAIPSARHALEGALMGRWHWSNGPLVAHHRLSQPREASVGQEGPHPRAPQNPTLTLSDTPPSAAGMMGLTAFPVPEVPAPPGIEISPPAGPSLAVTDPDASRVKQAIDLYRRDDLAGGDAIARSLLGPVARLTLAWTALRLHAQDAGLSRMDAFAADHPDWPALGWLKRRIEEAVAVDKTDPARTAGRLRAAALQTVTGKIALATIDRAGGRAAAAAAIVRQVWREEDLTPYQEGSILHDFGDMIGREDHKYRADRLLYKEQTPNALREAALAGPDVVALVRARAAVAANAASDALIAAVPKGLSGDPGLLFARIQKARRANRIGEAADLMLSAPRDPAKIVDGDEWWVERRLIARKLLDRGDAKTAYRICAEHSAASAAMKIEAEFHAGWIALRFLDDPHRAADHFAHAATLAETPISKSRAAYWRGRVAEALGGTAEAARFYGEAAQYSISFYGQLAAGRIGRTDIALRASAPAATGNTRSEAVRVTEYLFALGQRDIALPLALDIARSEPSEAQVAALGDVVAKARDAWATLTVGKVATQRGMGLDEIAFPTFGIPNFQPLPNSADLATVYAIARQESEFDPRSLSSAGAKGLMQMISSTARRTAERAGILYDETRLGNDAAFNAQLGAAHLGALLGEQGGSYVLTFAAYNAGGRNVKDWIEAYGDPRKPGVDPVDWIERIPFSETRNYVQRVLENLLIYRIRLGRPAAILVGNDAPPPGKGT